MIDAVKDAVEGREVALELRLGQDEPGLGHRRANRRHAAPPVDLRQQRNGAARQREAEGGLAEADLERVARLQRARERRAQVR